MINCYIYTHFNFGIGHFQRAKLLAEEFSKKSGYNVILVSSGVPLPKRLTPKKIKLLQLPAEEHGLKYGTTVSTNKMTKAKMNKARIKILKDTFFRKRPDIFITEFFPFAAFRLNKTLLPILKHLKVNYPNCLISCSTRDIPISDVENPKKYNFQEVENILNEYYDCILVHATKELSEFRTNGIFKKLKTSVPIYFTGYVVDKNTLRYKVPKTNNKIKKILVTAGGGRDGEMIFKLVLQALKIVNKEKEIQAIFVLGPLNKKRDTLGSIDQNWCKSVDSIPNLNRLMFKLDLIISMAGYNTIAELFVSGAPAIIFPRPNSYEQFNREKLFTKIRGISNVVDLKTKPEKLAKIILNMIKSRRSKPARAYCQGQINSVKIIDNLIKKI